MQPLDQLFKYDSITGIVYYATDRGRYLTGDIAGSLRTDGYIRIRCYGKNYYAHVLAWYLYYGKWPSLELDHKNRIRDDNRIDNLREATRTMQQDNSSRAPKYGKYIWKSSLDETKYPRRYHVMINRKQIGEYYESLEYATYVRDSFLQSAAIDCT